jgi:Ketol-acid reductoisomerase
VPRTSRHCDVIGVVTKSRKSVNSFVGSWPGSMRRNI